jgi:hypothetical protein
MKNFWSSYWPLALLIFGVGGHRRSDFAMGREEKASELGQREKTEGDIPLEPDPIFRP